ncbi:MAG TPA: hypothetical protein VIB00_04535, partial [Pyrinomonadaceae bacterium]
MDTERLRQIEERYHAALALPPDQREAFVQQSCSGDEELRREVENLLEVKNSSNNFFETPPLSLVAEMFTPKER